MNNCQSINIGSSLYYHKIVFGDSYEDCLKSALDIIMQDFTIFGLKKVALSHDNKQVVKGILDYTFSDDTNLVYQSVKNNKGIQKQNGYFTDITIKDIDAQCLNEWCNKFVKTLDGNMTISAYETDVIRRVFARRSNGNVVYLTIKSVDISDDNKVAINIEEDEK